MSKTAVLWLVFAVSVVTTFHRAEGQTDTLWVEATGKCYSTEVTPEQGWRRALQDAEASAIRSALGISIASQTFQITSETMKGGESSEYLSTFSRLNASTTSGRVIDEQVLDSSLSRQGNFPEYLIKIRAKVAKDRGEADPGFRIEIGLDKDVYYDRGNIDRNDEIRFSLSATRDCYLYIFDIMANDSVVLLVPNVYVTDNFFAAGEGRKWLEKKLGGLSLRAVLPAKKEIATEMIYVVGLKKKMDFCPLGETAASPGIIPTYRSALLDMQKWLVLIPQDRRTSAAAPFTIRKSK